MSTRARPLSMSQCRVESCWVSHVLIACSAALPPLDIEALVCAATWKLNTQNFVKQRMSCCQVIVTLNHPMTCGRDNAGLSLHAQLE